MAERFGEKARDARLAREITLKRVADELGFTPAYVSDIERGHRNPPGREKIRRWAEVLGVDPLIFARDAQASRTSFELPIAGNPSKGRLAFALTRAWDHLTPEQESELLKFLEQVNGGNE